MLLYFIHNVVCRGWYGSVNHINRIELKCWNGSEN